MLKNLFSKEKPQPKKANSQHGIEYAFYPTGPQLSRSQSKPSIVYAFEESSRNETNFQPTELQQGFSTLNMGHEDQSHLNTNGLRYDLTKDEVSRAEKYLKKQYITIFKSVAMVVKATEDLTWIKIGDGLLNFVQKKESNDYYFVLLPCTSQLSTDKPWILRIDINFDAHETSVGKFICISEDRKDILGLVFLTATQAKSWEEKFNEKQQKRRPSQSKSSFLKLSLSDKKKQEGDSKLARSANSRKSVAAPTKNSPRHVKNKNEKSSGPAVIGDELFNSWEKPKIDYDVILHGQGVTIKELPKMPYGFEQSWNEFAVASEPIYDEAPPPVRERTTSTYFAPADPPPPPVRRESTRLPAPDVPPPPFPHHHEPAHANTHNQASVYIHKTVEVQPPVTSQAHPSPVHFHKIQVVSEKASAHLPSPISPPLSHTPTSNISHDAHLQFSKVPKLPLKKPEDVIKPEPAHVPEVIQPERNEIHQIPLSTNNHVAESGHKELSHDAPIVVENEKSFTKHGGFFSKLMKKDDKSHKQKALVSPIGNPPPSVTPKEDVLPTSIVAPLPNHGHPPQLPAAPKPKLIVSSDAEDTAELHNSDIKQLNENNVVEEDTQPSLPPQAPSIEPVSAVSPSVVISVSIPPPPPPPPPSELLGTKDKLPPEVHSDARSSLMEAIRSHGGINSKLKSSSVKKPLGPPSESLSNKASGGITNALKEQIEKRRKFMEDSDEENNDDEWQD